MSWANIFYGHVNLALIILRLSFTHIYTPNLYFFSLSPLELPKFAFCHPILPAGCLGGKETERKKSNLKKKEKKKRNYLM